jgi:catechol 2,3-dioxygenase-like lactoylglutathione lyase family enzyme
MLAGARDIVPGPFETLVCAPVTSRIDHTTFDCHDAFALSTFWAQVLGFTDVPGDPNEPGHEECMIIDPGGGQRVLFIEVPEGKQVKNRVHFDLVPTDRTRDEEIERVLALGATPLDDRRRPDGTGWLVLADPEGNEFCILRSDAER